MYLRAFIITLVTGLLLPAALVLTMDPYRVWHDRGFERAQYSDNQRFQNPGLIRKFLECADCKPATIIVGTSVSENTTLDDLLQTGATENAVRLIAHGSYPIEQWHTLQRALASGKVQTVYWEIYRNYVSPDYNQFPGHGDFPVYLYNNAFSDDWRYLFNHNAVLSSLTLATTGLNWSTELGTLNSWQVEAMEKDIYAKWNDPDNLDWQNSLAPKRIAQWQGSTPDWSQPVPVFDEYIYPLVAQYPEVNFVFFTPPVSLARRAEDLGESLSGQLVLKEKLAVLSEQRANLSMYSFDLFLPLVSDMAWYKDAGHYTAAVNRWMLERMAADDPRFRVKPANSRAEGERLWELAINYELVSSCVATPANCGQFDPAVIDP